MTTTLAPQTAMSAVGLRQVMRSFATGVCLATTFTDESDRRVHDAITVNSLTSVSLAPPLISVCLRNDSMFLADLIACQVWGVSILDLGGDDLAVRFSRDREERAEALAGAGLVPGPRTGALVKSGHSWMECELFRLVEAGDHTVVIGEVLNAESAIGRPPLLFLHGRFRAPRAPWGLGEQSGVGCP
ncbi:flavin reductase family protein [Knoellia sp. CPCC 206453]|uniref:flavin reductase family protein n=1 Tax=Knoellia pratensis TaxID=3404796 RepID=UPI003620733A